MDCKSLMFAARLNGRMAESLEPSTFFFPTCRNNLGNLTGAGPCLFTPRPDIVRVSPRLCCKGKVLTMSAIFRGASTPGKRPGFQWKNNPLLFLFVFLPLDR